MVVAEEIDIEKKKKSAIKSCVLPALLCRSLEAHLRLLHADEASVLRFLPSLHKVLWEEAHSFLHCFFPPFFQLLVSQKFPCFEGWQFPPSTEHLFSGEGVRGEKKWHDNTLAKVVHSTVHIAAGCFWVSIL